MLTFTSKTQQVIEILLSHAEAKAEFCYGKSWLATAQKNYQSSGVPTALSQFSVNNYSGKLFLIVWVEVQVRAPIQECQIESAKSAFFRSAKFLIIWCRDKN